MMTEAELQDVRAIAASVNRIESKVDENRRVQDAHNDRLSRRLDELEKFADRASGALTLAKVVLSFLGVGGVAAVFAILSRGNL